MRIAVPGRALVLVAGMPGAGKSTLLAGLPPDPRAAVLDSDAQRAALRRVLPGLRYRHYRWLVHLLHRCAVLRAACSAVPVVVVHLPATDPATRAVLARLAALTGRTAHLLWLHVDAVDARRGQRERGRVVSPGSFSTHAERAASTTAALRDGPGGGWHEVRVLDRAAAAGGLRLVHGERCECTAGAGPTALRRPWSARPAASAARGSAAARPGGTRNRALRAPRPPK